MSSGRLWHIQILYQEGHILGIKLLVSNYCNICTSHKVGLYYPLDGTVSPRAISYTLPNQPQLYIVIAFIIESSAIL